MLASFPAGHRFLVNFRSFRVVLDFASNTSLTYTVLEDDGSSGQVETVVIDVKPLRENLFLVTWQEADKTTVVHVEDYDSKTIVTNIVGPNNQFDQFVGTFEELHPGDKLSISTDFFPNLADAKDIPLVGVSYHANILPLFRPADISCMRKHGVLLDDATWMRSPENAQSVYDELSTGDMPPDGAWPAEQIALFKQWIADGLEP